MDGISNGHNVLVVSRPINGIIDLKASRLVAVRIATKDAWGDPMTIPPFDANGNLPPGVHKTTIRMVVKRFGWNDWRRRLCAKLEMALAAIDREAMNQITNDRQYNVTKGQLAKLRNACEVAEADRDRMDPRVYRAMVAGIGSHIGELEARLREYENLKKGVRKLPIKSFADLPRLLIEGRIARGLTQRDLALCLGIKPQQVQKYEKTEYASASLRRILDVIRILDFDLNTEVRLDREEMPPKQRGGNAVS